MNIFFHLFAGLGISFIGSLPMGIINLYVFETAVKHGRLRAFFVALGAVMVEMVQATVALLMVNYMYQYPNAAYYARIFSIPVFLVIGMIQLFAKPAPKSADNIAKYKVSDSSKPAFAAFGMGIFLSSINMMAIPYWLFYTSYLVAGGYLHSHAVFYTAVYIAGIACGSLLVCMLYAQAGNYIAQRFTQNTTIVNRVVGCILIALAVYTAWQVWQHPAN
ncbi:hypothetical protein C7N43_29735 [Sphingobacteriales bacterium UPWRP_1]|nr:hypothetical protein B6N25_02140 [Sphingobacteriales bacterium TSM_CSS]PSJ73318.1 hypothetical protein C7N43_29735 [Sphingobacteriales bacterium UPWRP_1]